MDALHGDLLVFTDADTLFRKDWLEVIWENLVNRSYDVSSEPVLFHDRTPQSDLVQLWRTQYKFLQIFEFYRLIGSNVALKRDTYERIGDHREISILEDYDLSVRLFKEGNISCRDDQRQTVFTSARRFDDLHSYMKTYLYGHYHVTKDCEKLLQYPPCFRGQEAGGNTRLKGPSTVTRRLSRTAGTCTGAANSSPWPRRLPTASREICFTVTGTGPQQQDSFPADSIQTSFASR